MERPAPGRSGDGSVLMGLENPRAPSALTTQTRKHEAEDSAFLASLDLPCTPVLGSLFAQFALAKLGALVERGEQPVGDPVIRHCSFSLFAHAGQRPDR